MNLANKFRNEGSASAGKVRPAAARMPFLEHSWWVMSSYYVALRIGLRCEFGRRGIWCGRMAFLR